MAKLIDVDALKAFIKENGYVYANTLDTFPVVDTQGIPTDRIKELCEAEKDGRCVVLPCKVGDTVWFIKSAFSLATFPIKANHVSIRGISCDGEINYAAITDYNKTERRFTSSDIGKTVFLSKEAAENALKERESRA